MELGSTLSQSKTRLIRSPREGQQTMKPIMFGAVLLVIGCGGAHDAVEAQTAANATADTTAAIAAAETAAPKDHPQASLHLKLAKDQLQQAKKLLEDEEDEKARLLLQRATADAELALMLARKTDAEQKAERARAQVQSLSRHQ